MRAKDTIGKFKLMTENKLTKTWLKKKMTKPDF